MSKAFTRESDGDDEDDLPEESGGLPITAKNYMTPEGFARMREELDTFMRKERPEVVKVVSWAAGNGDRSENGDYIYGKKRLREIDRRVRYLSKRLANAEVVDPAKRGKTDQVFFGATVTTANEKGEERTIRIVGVDEVDLAKGHVSWISPIAKALLRAEEGDVVKLRTPGRRGRARDRQSGISLGRTNPLISFVGAATSKKQVLMLFRAQRASRSLMPMSERDPRCVRKTMTPSSEAGSCSSSW